MPARLARNVSNTSSFFIVFPVIDEFNYLSKIFGTIIKSK